MPKSLLEELPEIVKAGKRQAEQILEQIDGPGRVTLQTRELVIPARAHAGLDFSQLSTPVDGEPNRLIYGDNLLAMAALLAGDETAPSTRGAVDLIYIDPPFDSRADYRSSILLPAGPVNQRPTVAEQFAYSDTWVNGTASYLQMLVPRFVLMREMLKESGSIYVHMGAQVNHAVRLVADEIFGRDNFVEEIIWAYGSPSGGRAGSTKLVKVHEYLLHYARSYSSRFEEKVHLPYSEKYIADWFKHVDEDGRRYQRRSRGDGKWERQYLDESKGVPASTVWTDIQQVYADPRAYKANQAKHSEITGYATQKPERLLERIIVHTCPPGGLVADFFIGSGTTAATAEKLGRRWIASDLGKPATMITRKRLVDQEAAPFLYQAIGDYQIEQARSTLGRRFRVGDLSKTVLGLYGALPLPPEENINGSLGHLPGHSTLVMVDSPARLTTASTLSRAAGYRDSKMGGFAKVVVLGWNFTSGIGHDIAALDDPRLEVRAIPANLLDELKKKGEKALARNIRFSTLQYLQAHIESMTATDDRVDLEIVLDNYVLLDPDALPLHDDESRERVVDVMNREPLALIEYWAIDPDYDGEVFRSTWQDYRGNVDSDDDSLRIVTRAFVSTGVRRRPHRVCVRAVDVFGFESEVVLEVNG